MKEMKDLKLLCSGELLIIYQLNKWLTMLEYHALAHNQHSLFFFPTFG